MMTILIPTDYSSFADHALAFAIHYASRHKVKLVVIHVDEILIPTSTPHHLYEEKYKEALMEKQQDLEIYAKKATHDLHHSRVSIVTEWIDNFSFQDAVGEAVTRYKADLILMGTKGASGLKKVFWGSNTIRVMQNTTVPVLAIPQDAAFSDLRVLAYASDLKQVEKETKQLLPLAKQLNSEIHIFHVYPNYPQWIDPSEENLEKILRSLRRTYPNQKISLTGERTSNENETREGILSYVRHFSPDVLVMFPEERSFLEKIFFSSNTEEITSQPTVPVLIIPAK